ncbi:MAG: aspartyl/asparaginyl beta-hydroxylase domain-containing protein [Chitinophagales bacterium]|nr:aspartyl/asparaginyl beta-hydroxylase domain-containing protein [Chitinophagales bacterium]
MQSPLWFRFFKSPFNGEEPRYFDINHKEWVAELERRFPDIQKEVTLFVKQESIHFKNYRFHISNGKPQWQTFPLMSWGYIHKSNQSMLPVTWSIFNKIEGICSISISRLVAGASIPGHHGDTNAIYRCHYGIQIPAGKPDCVFVVEDEEKEWVQGKTLAFCDARFHYAENHTNQDRYVVLFDVIRDPFVSKYYSICSTVIATHVLHGLDSKISFYEKCPVLILKALVYSISVPAKIYLRLQNLLK